MSDKARPAAPLRPRALPRVAGGAIAVPFVSKPATEGELDELAGMGANMFELRIDLLEDRSPPAAASAAAAFAKHPLIVTCRRQDEGGKGGDDTERMLALAASITHANAVDIELASAGILPKVAKLAQDHGCDLIVSHHDMHSTPELARLEDTLLRAWDTGPTIVKMVTTVSRDGDLANLSDLLELALAKGIPLAVMGMGGNELASKSRLQLAREGSVFVFASQAATTAPGQPNLSWLAKELRKPA